MKEFHCSSCNKLLGKIEGKAEIKCPRCKTMNIAVTFEQFALENKGLPPGTRIPITKNGKDIIYL